MNHANMYINVYEAKCNRGFVGKEVYQAKSILVEGTSSICEKKDGTLTLCIDYMQLNKVTVKNKYPLP